MGMLQVVEAAAEDAQKAAAEEAQQEGVATAGAQQGGVAVSWPFWLAKLQVLKAALRDAAIMIGLEQMWHQQQQQQQ